MAKLGEERLGSFMFATPSEFVPETDEVRERAEANMKSPYPTDPGTVWDRFLNTILFEFEIMQEVTADILDQRFVESATMYQLNMIGELLGVERREGESDALYRARIKLQLPRHTTTTTNDFIRSVCAQLLGTDKSRFKMIESHTPRLPTDWDDMDEAERDEWLIEFDDGPKEPARFDIHIEDIVMSSAELTADDLEELVQDVKAAGVRAFVTIGHQFTHRGHVGGGGWGENYGTDYGTTEVEENDPDKAYGGYDDETIDGYDRDTDHPLTQSIDIEDHPQAEYDPDLGAPYADEITRQFG